MAEGVENLNVRMLRVLVTNRATIANFPEIRDGLGQRHKKHILEAIKGNREHTKWLSGKANLPLKFLQELLISKKLSMDFLRESRFSVKGAGPCKVRLPLEVNEDLAYFLGILAGDGHISNPKPHQARWWIIQMCEDALEFQSLVYIPLVERLFCYTPKIHVNKRTDGRRNVYTRINSFVIILYLTNVLGIRSGYKTDIVDMPVCILHSEEKIRLAFVRGLFDTDGTVTEGTARYSTVSEKLFYQVQTVLRSSGIEFRTNVWKKNEIAKQLYTIVIPKRQLGNFSKIVGFKNCRKKIKLEHLLAPSSSGQG